MKQSVALCVIPMIVFLIISCPLPITPNPSTNPKSGTFWALYVRTGEYYKVDSILLATGEKCVVWAERSAGISVSEGQAIAHEYDNNIYDKIVNTFGSPKIMEEQDVDGDGKLTLFLLDIQDGFTGSGAYTAGYFFSDDLLVDSPTRPSNEKDMIYVDTYPSTLRSPESYATIAHELQHFINFSTRYTIKYGYRPMDTWIDEGLSLAAEYIYLGGHNMERVIQFNQSETVTQGNNFFVWGNRPNSLLDEYSTVYLFFQWLRIQSGGNEIYKHIITSPNSDWQAVTGAISGDFAENLGSVNWETMLRSWLAANYINSPEGLYGYHGELPNLCVRALGGLERSLSPGEGVYSAAADDDTPGALPDSGGTNIKYAGLRKDSPEESPLSLTTLHPNGRLLTFNSNENGNGSPEKGKLAGGAGETIPQVSSVRTSRSAGQPGDSWIIDARDIFGRTNGDD